MDYNFTVFLILAVGAVILWLYHRKRDESESPTPNSNRVIILGILFVMGMLYLLKQAEMLPG